MSLTSEHSSFLYGANAPYIAELYGRYCQNPSSVDTEWQSFFSELGDSEQEILAELTGAPWLPNKSHVIGVSSEDAAAPTANAKEKAPLDEATLRQATKDSIRALMLIRSYRVRGHLLADLDPLGLKDVEPHPELTPEYYGFTDADYDHPIHINNVLGHDTITLRELMALLQRTYSGHIGVEYMHIQDPEQKAWVQEKIETYRPQSEFETNQKKKILEDLTISEGFEKFLHVKYPGTKRFGLDGGESLIPALEQILLTGSEIGVSEVVLGMAHRGRLNVLTNILKKPYKAILSEFQGTPANPDDVQGSGDVKYHLGSSNDRDFGDKEIHISLTPNPSHLEVVNPVVLGKVRAKQRRHAEGTKIEDADRLAVLGILIHGDAAFAGQGLVSESILMHDLQGYRTGGTIHIVINNQIGFTTNPVDSRSGPYATDVALSAQAPIFHVNGDDPEAVVHTARLAMEFRQKFQKDVVIDMICYRRHGHNEGDEPAFTQPIMYREIKTHTTTRTLYATKLASENILSDEESKKLADTFHAHLEQEFEEAKSYKPNKADMFERHWAGFGPAPENYGELAADTAVSKELFLEVGKGLSTVPEDFNLNSKIARQLKAKADMFETGEGFDWATGEALAFGTLLCEENPVRLSGQDCGRGTFSQRHSVLYDQKIKGKDYRPLNHIREEGQQEFFEVLNSPLSEAGVLGFEYGGTLTDPKTLTIWEAQFGDFANGAQVIMDQFISSGESKWLRFSGLTLMLPHGFEGQGPEHSSARPERYLQQCAEGNMQVANVSTPANLFHILRRQMRRNFRKPLILFTPKSLLRHKLCVSDMKDFIEGSKFEPVLHDPLHPAFTKNDSVKRVVLCSGKVYYDLLQERDNRNIKDVAIVRIEQLYPFPAEGLKHALSNYPNAEVIWAQEEPQNMGYWTYVDRRIENVLGTVSTKSSRPSYVGRKASASPATGLLSRHNEEQAKLVDDALTFAK